MHGIKMKRNKQGDSNAVVGNAEQKWTRNCAQRTECNAN